MKNSIVLQHYISQLPEHAQIELFDFAEFLFKKYQSPQLTATPRRAGLHKGQIIIADDFDEPLDDTFWLGEE